MVVHLMKQYQQTGKRSQKLMYHIEIIMQWYGMLVNHNGMLATCYISGT